MVYYLLGIYGNEDKYHTYHTRFMPFITLFIIEMLCMWSDLILLCMAYCISCWPRPALIILNLHRVACSVSLQSQVAKTRTCTSPHVVINVHGYPCFVGQLPGAMYSKLVAQKFNLAQNILGFLQGYVRRPHSCSFRIAQNETCLTLAYSMPIKTIGPENVSISPPSLCPTSCSRESSTSAFMFHTRGRGPRVSL